MQRKQIVMLSKQNNDLRAKINKQPQIPATVTIRYESQTIKSAAITEECNLLLAPLEVSPSLLKLTKDTIVEVLDGAEISGVLWYEISLPIQDRVNSKGWLKASCVQFIAPNNFYDMS